MACSVDGTVLKTIIPYLGTNTLENIGVYCLTNRAKFIAHIWPVLCSRRPKMCPSQIALNMYSCSIRKGISETPEAFPDHIIQHILHCTEFPIPVTFLKNNPRFISSLRLHPQTNFSQLVRLDCEHLANSQLSQINWSSALMNERISPEFRQRLRKDGLAILPCDLYDIFAYFDMASRDITINIDNDDFCSICRVHFVVYKRKETDKTSDDGMSDWSSDWIEMNIGPEYVSEEYVSVYQTGQIIQLPCGHIFHTKCCESLLACACCRNPIFGAR